MRLAPYLLILLPVVALASPQPPAQLEHVEGGVFRLAEPVGETLDPGRHDAILERAAGRAPAHADAVVVRAVGPDGVERPLEHYLPPLPPGPDKQGEAPRRSWPADHPGAGAGWLSGKAVYLSQCHGWIWYDSVGRFATQRGEHFDTVEDFHNPEALNQFLAPYLENAGAAVFTVKERGMGHEMAIADNDGGGYTETGSGFTDGPAGFAEQPTWSYGEDPFDAGTTRRFPADGGGVATWTPQVPADGTYAVYVSWDSDSSHATDAHYRITHPSGTIDRWFDQTVHGSTWQYLDTLWLPEGTAGLTVELIGDSAQSGAFLSADAVRVGAGMGDVVRHGDTTGRPRWESGAIQYTQFNGAPPSVYDPWGNGNGTDPTARSKWAKWEHPAGEDAVYLSWHSNACGTGDGCTARGTVTYVYGPASECSQGARVDGSYDLAYAVNDELVTAFRTWWEPDWPQRGGDDGVAEACFAEVNPGYNDEMPAALVELAFHNNETDAWYLKQPEFRLDAARAMYRGIVRWFAERDGVTPHYLPEPPVELAVVHGADGKLRASWAPGPSGDPFGDPAESYRLFTSADGRSWSEGTEVAGTSTTLDVGAGDTVYVRVAAVNQGGTSFPSEVVGARRSSEGATPVLVVSAFDRLDTGLLPWEDASPTGMVRRMELSRVNPYDTAVAHGRAVAAAGYPFDTVSDEAFDDLELSAYGLVVWVAGEESTVDETFSDHQQQKLRGFVDGGGALFASGAEILWDLDHKGSESDRAFAAEVLGATYDTDDAGTTMVDGAGLLQGLGPLDFGEAAGGGYPVEYPDTLSSEREVLATYDGGAIAGVMGDGVVLFGFPFETIGDPAVRRGIMDALLPVLLSDYDPPDGTDTGGPDTSDPDGDWERHEIPASGCGCDGSRAPASAWLLILALVAVRRGDRC